MEADPSKTTHGTFAAQAGKDSLVVVTHGWNPDLAWLRAMTNSIGQYLTAHNLGNWQVAGYEWFDGAEVLNPQKALENAKQEGIILGNHVVLWGYTNVHLIGHSAGAGLVQAASEWIKAIAPETTVHCTFLDPYVGWKYQEASVYGDGADWADCHFSRDPETGGGLYELTAHPLSHAYNVDVTQLHKVKVFGAFISWGPNVGEPCERAETSHGWSHDFYSNTITGNVTSEYGGFGFPLSKEVGNWDYALASYTPGSSTNLGTPDPNCISLLNTYTEVGIPVNIAGSASYEVGDIARFVNGLMAITHSPSWLATFVIVTNPVNFVSFDAQFQSGIGADGLLSVYWDANTIGSVEERAVESGPQHYTFTFPTTGSGGHVLGFRLDPFTNIQSIVAVTNVVLGRVGVSQPFRLAFTTNTVNNLHVLELIGESGNYIVQASTNLFDWESSALLVNTNSSVRFFDQNSTNFSQRFYRAVATH